MAFDVKKNRGASDDIQEVDSESSNETTMELLDEASNSNVLATQNWVSRMLKRFCAWTRVFHTDVLHATSEVVTANVRTRELHTEELYATSLVLTNEDGGMVRLSVGKDGKIDIQETLCDVFVYPGDNMVREYAYRSEDIVSNFAGLTSDQVLLNFIPFVGWKSSEFNGKQCYILCQADGKDELVKNTLLFNVPNGKVVRSLRVLDSSGDEVKYIGLPYENNFTQITINMPCFRNRETGSMCYVPLPEGSSIWIGDRTVQTAKRLPPVPESCSGFVPPSAKDSIPEDASPIGKDIFDDTDISESGIDPEAEYDVVNETYQTGTYYNIVLKRSDFVNNQKQQYLVVDVQDREQRGGCCLKWGDDTQGVG